MVRSGRGLADGLSSVDTGSHEGSHRLQQPFVESIQDGVGVEQFFLREPRGVHLHDIVADDDQKVQMPSQVGFIGTPGDFVATLLSHRGEYIEHDHGLRSVHTERIAALPDAPQLLTQRLRLIYPNEVIHVRQQVVGRSPDRTLDPIQEGRLTVRGLCQDGRDEKEEHEKTHDLNR